MNTLSSLLQELEKYGTKKYFQPHQIFIREGSIPNKLAIVKSGLFRYYYLTQDGKEYTKVFMPEKNIISSYTSMVHNIPSHFTIEALENSVIVEITYHNWLKIRDEDPKWNFLLIANLEKAMAKKEQRERDLLFLDAETRYIKFLKEYPHLDNRINLTLIASFLGIQPESLSRIRKKLAT